MRIGVLALQGDFALHLRLLTRLGVAAVAVRRPGDLQSINGLIIPGGESSTIGMLLQRAALARPLKQWGGQGQALMGTCAGAILMARQIINSAQFTLGMMDIEIERNAYGRQIDSFEAQLTVSAEGTLPATPPPVGVFIRAPIIRNVGAQVTVLARFKQQPVLVQERHMLAATFHPELADETGIHSHFLGMVAGR